MSTIRITYADGTVADIAEDALLAVDCMLVDECREIPKADAPDAVAYAERHRYGDRFGYVVFHTPLDGGGAVPVPFMKAVELRGHKAMVRRGETWHRVTVESWEDEARRLRATANGLTRLLALVDNEITRLDLSEAMPHAYHVAIAVAESGVYSDEACRLLGVSKP